MTDLIDAILDSLQRHTLSKSVRVINYDETPTGKLELKIRCRLTQVYQLQIWLHRDLTFLDYAYQLFTDHPILRWDNAPHYPHLATAPHHFHMEDATVYESALTGRVLDDLKQVLAESEKWLAKNT